MFQAEAISQSVALILDGTVKQTGTNRQIFNNSNKYLTSFSRLENVFSGESKMNKDNTSTIRVAKNLEIYATFCRRGKVSVHVRPEEILVSIKPFQSSARNMFKGIITQIADKGSVVRLTVDAGRKFNVQITKKSLTEMKLNIGSNVYLTFKASAVKPI
jgi:molybdopterin-binding protein